MIDIYVTCKNRQEAVKIAKHLLKLKLAGCVNIFPIESLYWWQGRIVEDKEIAMLIKVLEKNYSRIEKEITKLHSYTIPCIITLNVKKANKAYLKWLKEVSK